MSPSDPYLALKRLFRDERRPAVRAVRDRLETVVDALGGPPFATSAPERWDAIAALLDDHAPRSYWLLYSVVTGDLATVTTVDAACRRSREHSAAAVLANVCTSSAHAIERKGGPPAQVRVIREATTVDVHHTASWVVATGIQRVVRETVVRWQKAHEVTLIGWGPALDRLVELAPGVLSSADRSEPPARATLVPWNGRHLVPELCAEAPRAQRLEALARFSGCSVGTIGYDLVPVTISETVADGLVHAFAGYLSALKYCHSVAAISEAAAAEYEGWATMVEAAELPRPVVRPVVLASESAEPSAAAAARVRELYGHDPLVVCVGSHEPRKNHLAVLHAAETLWRRGLNFRMLFIGGHGWKGERFAQRVSELQARGRQLEALRAVDDDFLWAAYRQARFLVFPSLNEGFGLPVAEALASGTPVITTNYGSTREIATDGGALLVDPRDDGEITSAMERLLTDEDLRETLAAEARSRRPRTWSQYAEDTWRFLADGSTRRQDPTRQP